MPSRNRERDPLLPRNRLYTLPGRARPRAEPSSPSSPQSPPSSSHLRELDGDADIAPDTVLPAVRASSARAADSPVPHAGGDSCKAPKEVGAWAAPVVAICTFVLMFGGYVAMTEMGKPVFVANDAGLTGRAGVVAGMVMLQNEPVLLFKQPPARASLRATPHRRHTTVAAVRQNRRSGLPGMSAAGPSRPSLVRAQPPAPPARNMNLAAQRENSVQPAPNCLQVAQPGCAYRYETETSYEVQTQAHPPRAARALRHAGAQRRIPHGSKTTLAAVYDHR